MTTSRILQTLKTVMVVMVVRELVQLRQDALLSERKLRSVGVGDGLNGLVLGNGWEYDLATRSQPVVC